MICLVINCIGLWFVIIFCCVAIIIVIILQKNTMSYSFTPQTIYRYSKEEVLGAIDILFFSVSSKEIPADVQQAYSVIIKNVPINHATLRQVC